jgi:transposase
VDGARRYPSGLADALWEIVERVLPLPRCMGRPEKHSRCVVIDAILYVLRTRCSWRYLLGDFPSWQTVCGHFGRLDERGVVDRMVAELCGRVGLARGRVSEPTAGVIDSQGVRAADIVPAGSCGYDAGKEINGRRRFVVTDSLGLVVVVWVVAACW